MTRFFIDFLDGRKNIEGEREVKELTLSLLNLKPGLHVLDAGCGVGDDAREIASLVGRLVESWELTPVRP